MKVFFKHFISKLFVFIILFIPVTSDAGFLSKEFLKSYSTRMHLQCQRKIMGLTLEIRKLEKEHSAIEKTNDISEIPRYFEITNKLSELKDELSECQKDLSFWASVMESYKEKSTTSQNIDSKKGKTHEERIDDPYGYTLISKNSDGSITHESHTKCVSCNGSGICCFCHGQGMQFVMGVGSYTCPCLNGKCYMCLGMGEIISSTTTYPDGSGSYIDQHGNSQVWVSEADFKNCINDIREERERDRESKTGRYGEVTCYSCHGSGKCPWCNNGISHSISTHVCSNCLSGHPGVCKTCKGKGKVYGIVDASKLY